MKFASVQSQIKDLQRQMQEIQSTCYVLYPISDGFQFIAYYDLSDNSMGYTVVDANMVEIKLLGDLPADVLVGFGKFVDMLEQWQNDSTMDFPFSLHVTDKIPEVRSEFDPPASDENLDGDEARLN